MPWITTWIHILNDIPLLLVSFLYNHSTPHIGAVPCLVQMCLDHLNRHSLSISSIIGTIRLSVVHSFAILSFFVTPQIHPNMHIPVFSSSMNIQQLCMHNSPSKTIHPTNGEFEHILIGGKIKWRPTHVQAAAIHKLTSRWKSPSWSRTCEPQVDKTILGYWFEDYPHNHLQVY